VLCVIALQYVAQDALPLAKRRVAQVIPQLRAPAAQGWSLLARQVAVQLRQHHQGEHLQGDLSRLDQAFEFLDIVVEYGQGFFVGMGNGKGILLADQPDEVSIHSAGSSVRGQGGCPVLPQMPSRCKLCGWMPAAGKVSIPARQSQGGSTECCVMLYRRLSRLWSPNVKFSPRRADPAYRSVHDTPP